MGRCGIGLMAAAVVWGMTSVGLAKEEIWRHDSAADLGKGRSEGVVVSEAGRVRLARPVVKVGELDATRVWDLATTLGNGGHTLWAATGDQGRIYRLVSETGTWVVAHESGDSQVFSLAAGPGGDRIAAGTGPGGLIIELDAAGTELASGPIDPESVQYVWDLAYQADGSLLAATGPNGQLWKKLRGGEWKMLFDAPQPHLLCLLVADDGTVIVGTDAGALIYRIAADGSARVLLDAPQEEIRVLTRGDDGAIYAGTASESAGGASTRSTRRGPVEGPRIQRASYPQGTAQLKSGATGENVVYRIDEASGTAREIHRMKGLILALSERKGRIDLGTGPEGRLLEVGDGGEEVTPLVRLDHGQILSLRTVPGSDEGLYLGVGDPGGVYRLEPGHVTSGTLTSEVLDAELPARFGALRVQSNNPPGTSVEVEVRTGHSAEPDGTWSDWVAPPTTIPNGRFAQYRLRLTTRDPGRTPEVTAVRLAYRTQNLRPEIASITVPDLSAGDGATRKTELELKWEASDPNDDPLTYTLAVRKEGWPGWIDLPTSRGPLTEKSFKLDTTTLPAGRYRLRVTARDDRGNPPAEALTGERTTEPFVVDPLPPDLTLNIAKDGRKATATLRDGLTRLVSAEYSLDGGEWTPAFADDGLFDTETETVTVALPVLAAGPHVLVFRATDAAGNLGSVDSVFIVP